MMQQETTAPKIIHLPEKLDSAPDEQAQPDKDHRSALRTLETLQRLNRSLDLDTLFETFVKEVVKQIPVDGFEYEYEPLKLSFQRGRHSKHSCFYNLVVEKQNIGKITFRRRQEFSAQEMTVRGDMSVDRSPTTKPSRVIVAMATIDFNN